MIRQTRVFRIRTRVLPNVGVAVEVLRDTHDGSYTEPVHAPMLLASKAFESTRAISAHPLSRTLKVRMLKSIAQAIKMTWEARRSDATSLANPGSTAHRIALFLGATGGAS